MKLGIVVGLAVVSIILFLLPGCAKIDDSYSCPEPYLSIDGICCPDNDRDGTCDPIAEGRHLFKPPVSTVTRLVTTNPGTPTTLDNWKQLYREKVKSYTFIGQAKNQFHAKFFVKGEFVRIDLENSIKANPSDEESGMINKVFLNTRTKQAQGVCSAGYTLCISRKGDVFFLPYDSYDPLLPVELFSYVESLKLISETPNAEIIDNRVVTLLLFKNAKGETVKLYVDEHYGVPLRYSIEKNGLKRQFFQYKQMTFNSVGNDDLKLPVLD